MKLVVFPAVDSTRLARLRETAGPHQVANFADEFEALREIHDADALLGKITPALLANAQRLRWVQSFTASLEHYIFPELVQHPCVLTNMRGLFSDVIADQVMVYVVCFARNLHTYIRRQLERRWEPLGGEAARVSFAAGPGVVSPIDLAHRHLGDQTIGIVGLGAIGSEIAKRAKAFGLRVLAIDAKRTDPGPDVEWVRSPENLPTLLSESDYVVIAAPHTPATAKLFRREQFRQMRPTAYLINIGRGAIVDLGDLVASLRAAEIAGAALDVFETEPLPADHPLWDFPNVIVTPHVAGYSPRVAERHLSVLVENIGRFVAGEALMNVVDKTAWF